MVANAGFGAPTRLDPLNTADVEETIRVNLMGVIYSIEAVLPGMLERRRGHLLAVSSLAAFKGLPGESAYCASKAAVNAYMEGMQNCGANQGRDGHDSLPGIRLDGHDADGFADAVHHDGRRLRAAGSRGLIAAAEGRSSSVFRCR